MPVDRYRVAFLYKRNRPAHRGFGRDVPHHQTIGSTREASVSYQSDRIAESRADDRRSRRQHLAHPGSALRPLITDHENIAFFDLARENCIQRVFLAIEYPRRPGDLLMLDPGDLRHRALGREV